MAGVQPWRQLIKLELHNGSLIFNETFFYLYSLSPLTLYVSDDDGDVMHMFKNF